VRCERERGWGKAGWWRSRRRRGQRLAIVAPGSPSDVHKSADEADAHGLSGLVALNSDA
jgi:hypothetical protein